MHRWVVFFRNVERAVTGKLEGLELNEESVTFLGRENAPLLTTYLPVYF